MAEQKEKHVPRLSDGKQPITAFCLNSDEEKEKTQSSFFFFSPFSLLHFSMKPSHLLRTKADHKSRWKHAWTSSFILPLRRRASPANIMSSPHNYFHLSLVKALNFKGLTGGLSLPALCVCVPKCLA